MTDPLPIVDGRRDPDPRAANLCSMRHAIAPARLCHKGGTWARLQAEHPWAMTGAATTLATACHRCYGQPVRPRTAAEEHFARRRSEPEYTTAYEAAARRVAIFDDIVRSLDVRRKELGLSKAELARRADMAPAAVRRLFSHQHKNPTLTSLVALTDALDLYLRLGPLDSSSQSSMSIEGADTTVATSAPSAVHGTHRRSA